MEIANVVTSPYGVGGKLIHELVRRGETVHTIFPSPKEVPMAFLGKINLKYGFVRLDRDSDIEKGLPRRATTVFHLYDLYQGPHLRVHQANVSATLSLLDWAKRVGVRQFVHLSSGEVYGQGKSVPETAPCQPRNFYATTKFHAEHLVRFYARSFEVKTVRVFFPFGPDDTQGFIRMLADAVRDGAVNETDYGTVCPTATDDLVDPLIRLRDLAGNHLFNVCGSPHAVSEIIELLQGVLGKSASRVKAGRTELCGDGNKAVEQLGFRETPFAEAIRCYAPKPRA